MSATPCANCETLQEQVAIKEQDVKRLWDGYLRLRAELMPDACQEHAQTDSACNRCQAVRIAALVGRVRALTEENSGLRAELSEYKD